MERTYALNDEAAVVVCDYGKAARPRIPFPYFAEAWTGLEYTAAALMMSWGMTEEGVEIVESARARYNGEKRNPWDEAECGHHYARAMSSWSMMLAMSGFRYDGPNQAVSTMPVTSVDDFLSLWATGAGWGNYSLKRQGNSTKLVIRVQGGVLGCRSCELYATGRSAAASAGVRSIQCRLRRQHDRAIVQLEETAWVGEGEELWVEVER